MNLWYKNFVAVRLVGWCFRYIHVCLWYICNFLILLVFEMLMHMGVHMSCKLLSVFLVCFQNSIFLRTLCSVFFIRSSLFYNNYVLFICTSVHVYKYVYSWAYCPMYKEINCMIFYNKFCKHFVCVLFK